MSELLVSVFCIACCCDSGIIIPCTHCPACCIVCVKRDRICFVFYCFQICDELIRSFRKLCDSCIFEYFLVVENSTAYYSDRNTVYFVLIQPSVRIFYFFLYGINISIREEICGKIRFVNLRDHHDVAPVTTLKTKERILCVIGNALDLNLDIRIHFVELF